MNSLRLAFEESTLLELRKTLFKKGLTPQQFFTYVTNLAAINDARIVDIIEEATEYADQLPSSRSNTLNADEIYSLIESGDKKT